MRGPDTLHESLFSVIKLEDFIPAAHPLRPIRAMVNQALAQMNGLFQAMYAADIKGGRPSIAPEKLLRAMLLQVFYSVRSERMLIEQIQYNMLYRWFVGLAIDDAVWVPTVFTKNRERLIKHDAIIELFNQVLAIAQAHHLLSNEHFSVDGTLIQAWAGHQSFIAKAPTALCQDDKPPSTPTAPAPSLSSETDRFKGQRRSNATHQSTTDADARLYCKGDNASRLRFMGHALTENRNGLVVNGCVTRVDGYCEREAAKAMIQDSVQAHDTPRPQITLGADKGYDAKEFIDACIDEIGVVPHVAQNKSGRASSVPDAIASTEGYAISMQKRKRIEQVFGWAKTVGAMRQVRVRGLARGDQMFMLTMAAYNLTRLRTITLFAGKLRLVGA